MTLIDRRNFHLFQPLALPGRHRRAVAGEHRGAAARRSSSEQRERPRAARRGDRVRPRAREVVLEPPTASPRVPYDSLIVATGRDAPLLRPRRVGDRTPRASRRSRTRPRSAAASCPRSRRPSASRTRRSAARLLTFVVVGGGPTGVEMAGPIGELARDTLPSDFRTIDPAARADRARRGRGRGCSPRSRRPVGDAPSASSTTSGSTTMVDSLVVGVDDEARRAASTPAACGSASARATVIWAAGVTAAPLAGGSRRPPGPRSTGPGRIVVEPDLHAPRAPRRDRARRHGESSSARTARALQNLPGVAPVAMQQGRYAAKSDRAPPARR